MIYPNPARTNITIDLVREYSKVALEVMDIQGQLIEKHTYEEQLSTIDLDLKNYEKGVYLLRITINDKSALFRIVKE